MVWIVDYKYLMERVSSVRIVMSIMTFAVFRKVKTSITGPL